MSIFRMSFAGQIKKCEHKQINGKAMVEASICKKHKGRNGAEDSFSWLKLTIWEPAEFQLAQLVKGAFIAGSGDYQLRSYEKDGVKGHSAEVRCTSFDIEIGGSVTDSGAVQKPAYTEQRAPVKPVSAPEDDGVPF